MKCKDCGQPMLPKGKVKKPNEYDHATGCPRDRYRVVGDNSGHEYHIPVSRSDEWDEWLKLDADDERSWEAPIFAVRLDGRFTFSDPRCE